MEYKALLGALAIIVGFIGYIPYFRDIFNGETKPHAFSWLIWAILTFIAFAGQIVAGGGPGSWVNGFTALVCFSIFLLAINKGTREFPLIDWFALFGAGLGLALWLVTKNPTSTIIIITIVDFLAFIPTIRKSIIYPNQETAFLYAVNVIKYSLGILALQKYSVATVTFLAAGIFGPGIVLIILLTKRTKARKV